MAFPEMIVNILNLKKRSVASDAINQEAFNISIKPQQQLLLGAEAQYNPLDIATLWQDSGRTIAVTAAGQTVSGLTDITGLGNHGTTTGTVTYQEDTGGIGYLQIEAGSTIVANGLAGSTNIAVSIPGVGNTSIPYVANAYWGRATGANNSTTKVGGLAFSTIGDLDYTLLQNSYAVGTTTTLRGMFYQKTTFNQPIDTWELTGVTDLSYMFYQASAFNQPIGSWDVSSVTNMAEVLAFATSFNQVMNNWDVGNVNNMQSLFLNCSSFNQSLNSWDTGNVTNMLYMLSGTTVFNQDLTTWCVTNIPSEPTNFATNSPLTPENKPIWGTCP